MSIEEKIRACRECSIRNYQPPVLDEPPGEGKLVMCVDFAPPLLLQANGELPAFDRCFPAGPLLEPALRELVRFGYVFYGSYLLKCPPLQNGVPRKPHHYELSNCFRHLQEEIRTYRPLAVLLLGHGTYLNVLSLLGLEYKKSYGYYFNLYPHEGTNYIPVIHPAQLDKTPGAPPSLYMEGIVNAVKRCSED